MPKRGENIYKRKDGRWEGRYIKGHINGRIQYGYRYARTYKEVKEKLAEARIISKKDELLKNPESYLIFADAAKEWLETLKPQLKDSSIIKYNNILTVYLLPYFGKCTVESITRAEIITFSNELLLSGGRKGAGLSSKTVTSILSVLKSVFTYVSQHEKHSVADLGGIIVKQIQTPMRILSIPEQQILSEYLCENRSLTNLGILLCLYTGMRIGEICALKWEDISFEEQYIYVNKTMQRLQTMDGQKEKTFVTVSAPKSNCSIRRIPLPDGIFRYLVAAKCPGNSYFLTGHPRFFIEPRTLQNRFKAVIKECHIEQANFHALRHTFATRCIELNFDVKSLSEILGHASVNITLNRYVHPSMELKQKNMNMLSELIAVR